MKIIGIIPARYGSTRFPGKPLVSLNGKPMIQHVVEQVEKVKGLEDVLVATDDQKIFEVVQSFGGKPIMTSDQHVSGTERCAEAVSQQRDKIDYVINIQGDEPLIQPEQIEEMVERIQNNKPDILTLTRPIKTPQHIKSPHVVKLVKGTHNQALYFSRSVIPYQRDESVKINYWQHIGVYAYKTDVLKELVQLPPSILEEVEQLEQNRWLENGYTIEVMISDYPTIAIDHPDDVHKVIQRMKNG